MTNSTINKCYDFALQMELLEVKLSEQEEEVFCFFILKLLLNLDSIKKINLSEVRFKFDFESKEICDKI